MGPELEKQPAKQLNEMVLRRTGSMGITTDRHLSMSSFYLAICILATLGAAMGILSLFLGGGFSIWLSTAILVVIALFSWRSDLVEFESGHEEGH